jgi:hypothetical protein
VWFYFGFFLVNVEETEPVPADPFGGMLRFVVFPSSVFLFLESTGLDFADCLELLSFLPGFLGGDFLEVSFFLGAD